MAYRSDGHGVNMTIHMKTSVSCLNYSTGISRPWTKLSAPWLIHRILFTHHQNVGLKNLYWHLHGLPPTWVFKFQLSFLLTICELCSLYSYSAFKECPLGITNIWATSRKALRNTSVCVEDGIITFGFLLQKPVSDGLITDTVTVVQL